MEFTMSTFLSVDLPVTSAKVVSWDHGRGGFEVILFCKTQRIGSKPFIPPFSTPSGVDVARREAQQFAANHNSK
jgi:hypothetical protein